MRTVHTAKRGQREDLIVWLKEFSSNFEGTCRVYKCMFGSQDATAIEFEFEDLAQYDRWRKENVANPKSQAEISPLFELTTGTHSETWELVE